MGKSTTERTLRLLKVDYGFQLVGIVERFCHNNRVPHGLRSDLYNIFDLVCADESAGIIGVQSCGPDFAAHYRKITQQYGRNASIWIRSGGRILLIGWRKIRAKKGSKGMITAPRVKEIYLKDLECEAAEIATTDQ
jgi:hypothetical protein